MTLKPIVWREAPYGFDHGFVDGLHLFALGHDALRPKGEEDTAPYILSCQLPGVERQRAVSVEAGKRLAEDILGKWVVRLMQPKA